MVEAAGRGELDVLWSSGGNFLDTLPDPRAVEAALGRVPLRVHVDIVASSQMLVDGEEVLLLPAQTRYEQPGGCTETTTERRVAFSPAIRGPVVGEAKAEWQIYLELAAAVDPEGAMRVWAAATPRRSARRSPGWCRSTTASSTCPGQATSSSGAASASAMAGSFPTHDAKAHFQVVAPRESELTPGRFLLSTRRGKQFNSMV